MLYQQTQHVESMLKFRRHVNINELRRHFDMLFWCDFDERIIAVILMYIFDITLRHRKSTQLQRASFVFFKTKNLGRVFNILNMRVVWPSFFRCNPILMYFFKVILFYLEISHAIISVSCNNVLLQIFSLMDFWCIESRVLLPATLQKELPQISCAFPEQILFRAVFKPNQTSKTDFIAKIVYIFKCFDYFL